MTLPVNLPEAFSRRLGEMRRPPDGKLHASGDLVGSLRHAQLRAAGAPETSPTVADEVVLMTGTLWHSWANEALMHARLPVMQEVKLDRWLPEGWSGTADWVFWNADLGGFVLGDLKTIRGDGVSFIRRDGAKREHLWQLSAYWHALYDAGLPMVKQFSVLYWPKDRGPGGAEPVVMECDPIPREEIHAVMDYRWQATKRYLGAIGDHRYELAESYLNEWLAPEQERIHKLSWNANLNVFDVKLTPHWSAAFCSYESPLCGCSEQGITKIGHYEVLADASAVYTPRKGYEDLAPEVKPSPSDLKRRSTS